MKYLVAVVISFLWCVLLVNVGTSSATMIPMLLGSVGIGYAAGKWEDL